MHKKYFYFLISFALFVVLFIPAYTFHSQGKNFSSYQIANAQDGTSDAPSAKLSEEELVSIVKPSVVRIVTHVEGDVSIIPFKISLKDFSVHSIPGEKPLKMPVNLDITGSGFVVNPEGYILTNSHVVSDTSAKIHIVQPIINLILAGELSSLSDAEAKKMNTDRTKEDGIAFGREILDYVVKQSTFNLTSKIVILDPTSNEQTLGKLTTAGFPVEIVSVNDNWYKDDKDVAVLKIGERNLPSLRLGGGNTLSVGAQVYVFGFPSNAELNGNSLLESTFTKGVVSAFKNSQNTDFKIFQTDAKISTGSSGGPLFDTDGQVAGLVTLETSSDNQSNGDNFAFAVPAEIAKTVLSNSFIINDDGIYGAHLKAGLLLARDKHCKNAIVEFNLAKGVNEKFGVAKYVDPYIEKCNALISSGFSIDSKWDEFIVKVRSMGMLAWALFAAGIFFLVILGVGVAVLLKHLKKDEAELNHLEHVIEHQGRNTDVTSPQSPFTTAVKQEKNIRDVLIEEGAAEKKNTMAHTTVSLGDPRPPNAALLDYIKQARLAGLTFQVIEKALKDAGWNDDEISRALAVPQS